MKRLLPSITIVIALGILAGLGLNFLLPRFELQLKANVEYVGNLPDSSAIQYKDALKAPDLAFNLPTTLSVESVNATSLLALDLKTKRIIVERNSQEKRSIASITKLLTALVALDYYSINEYLTVTVPPKIVDRNLGVGVGDRIQVRELLEAMLVYSSNDSAEILANECSCGGYKGFVGEMNEKAKVLGMNSSLFSNPSGYFDTGNFSTAYDLSRLASAFINSKAFSFVSLKQVDIVFMDNGNTVTKRLESTNELLGIRTDIKGLKTGYTFASGPSFVSMAQISGREYITVILNSEDRFGETSELISIIQKALIP